MKDKPTPKKKSALQAYKDERKEQGHGAGKHAPEAQAEINADDKLRLLDALQQTNGLVRAACRMAKIDTNRFYKFFHNDPDFKEAVNEIRQVGFDLTEEALFDLIEQRNPQVVIYAMKALGKDRGYAERQEVTGKDGKAIEVQTTRVILPMSDDDAS